MRLLRVAGLTISRLRLSSKAPTFPRLPWFATNQRPTWPLGVRSASSSEDGGDNEGYSSGEEEDTKQTALAKVIIPDEFPDVPLLTVPRSPVFPRFVKMLEVSDPDMIELIRRKLRLHAPYAGAFLKKTESEDEMVNSLDDIYDVGTFVQITEMAEQGSRIRMIIQGVRRYI